MNGRRHIYLKWCKILSRFFFDHVGAKKKSTLCFAKLQKESAVWGISPPAGGDQRSTALDSCRLLEKAGENFHCFGGYNFKNSIER